MEVNSVFFSVARITQTPVQRILGSRIQNLKLHSYFYYSNVNCGSRAIEKLPCKLELLA